MQAPRLIVLTPQKAGELPREYLCDRDRFPLEPVNTTDLAKARAWTYPPGVRRYLKRNPYLTGYRRVWVPAEQIKAAKASDAVAAEAPAPTVERRLKKVGVPSAALPRHYSNRATKTDPNKRSKRAARKRAVRAIRKAAEKPAAKSRRKGRKLARAA